MPSHFFDCVTRINEPIRLLDWREVRISRPKVGMLAYQTQGEEIFTRSVNTLVPKTNSRGRLSLQKLLYFLTKV